MPLAGTVHTATLVHRRERGLILATGPYPVIDVELASGHRLVLTTAAPSGQAPDIGTPVEIAFRTVAQSAAGGAGGPEPAPPVGHYRQEIIVMTVTDQATAGRDRRPG